MDVRNGGRTPLTTARLRLDAVVPADLGEDTALLADPGTWEHLPSGRRTWPEQTDPGAVRLALADRPLDGDLLAEVTALP